MQINCPNCDTPIPAEQINIQRMMAVCPQCSTVFEITAPGVKVKRRKVKQPDHLHVIESRQGMRLAFRTNFRLDRNEGFLTALFMGLMLTFLMLMMVGEAANDGQAALVLLAFGVMAFIAYYILALIAFNKTYINIDDGRIQVTRGPLPSPLMQTKSIDTVRIERVDFAETPASIHKAYDTPRYTVWATMADGSRKPIVSDVIDDYAAFIAQRLNEHLDEDASLDLAHLLDDDGFRDDSHDDDIFLDDGELPDSALPQSKANWD